MRLLWAYPGSLTPSVAVVMVGACVGFLAVGVLRGETRFHPERAAARSALGALAVAAFVAAAVALVLAVV